MAKVLDRDKIILELENSSYEEEDSNEFPPADLIAFNELRSCSDILRMYKTKQLDIQPNFQRGIVWQAAQQTRFIDSLTKQLPIPSMCISLDYKTNKRLVIDGLQRIYTIIQFLDKDDYKMSNLDDIDPKISGKTVGEIKKKYPDIYARVENLTIPITVIRYDSSKTNHNDYLFTIFHRLNTGGTKLTNQEIRNSIYQGSFNDLLKNLVEYPNWRKLLSLKAKRSSHKNAEENTNKYRFAYEELILRFFAFYDRYSKYPGRLTKFLNDYMSDNKNMEDDDLENKKKLFQKTVDIIYNKLFAQKPDAKISKVVMEGLLVAVAKNLDSLETLRNEELKQKYEELRESESYSSETLSGGLYEKDKTINRIQKSIEIFS
jgi:hypothetical protein